MSFIRADSLGDLLFAQGFVTARDRLFQMHLIRLLIQGRTAELAGYPALDQDRRMRTIGLDRLARRQAAILNPGNAALFQKYADGVNAFIVTAPQALHLEFRLAGISPEPWTVTDSLSLLYFWVCHGRRPGHGNPPPDAAAHRGIRQNLPDPAPEHPPG